MQFIVGTRGCLLLLPISHKRSFLSQLRKMKFSKSFYCFSHFSYHVHHIKSNWKNDATLKTKKKFWTVFEKKFWKKFYWILAEGKWVDAVKFFKCQQQKKQINQLTKVSDSIECDFKFMFCNHKSVIKIQFNQSYHMYTHSPIQNNVSFSFNYRIIWLRLKFV